jgi:hypothetical protein
MCGHDFCAIFSKRLAETLMEPIIALCIIIAMLAIVVVVGEMLESSRQKSSPSQKLPSDRARVVTINQERKRATLEGRARLG